MFPRRIEKILTEYQKRYQKAGINLPRDCFVNIAKENTKKAEENYLKIIPPKTCSKETYIACWIRETLQKDLNKRAMIKISHTKTYSEPYFQAIKDYSSLLPPMLILKINQEINNTPHDKREKFWESLNIPIKETRKKFTKLILTRIDYFLKKEKTKPLEFYLKHYKIPSKDYQEFKDHKNNIIKLCNQLLPQANNLPHWFYSEFNLPCFICQLSQFPIKGNDQVIEFVFQEYPELSKFRHKIEIKKGEPPSIKYNKMKDNFIITIDRYVNSRHQIMNLIHEMSHAINFIKDFKKDKNPFERGKYFQEKIAIETEFRFLKKLSVDIFKANLAKVLITFWTTIFEIELYKNPKQDIDKLYAKTFNQCFLKARQTKNPFYLLNDNILNAPFSNLPHAIAYAKILKSRGFDIS